jgi:glycosyltransferase involved in cell wall biosynthesis
MKAAFFDFTIAYGGAPAGTISLAKRLSGKMDVHIIDAYGQCVEYRKAVAEAGLPYHVLVPEAKNVFIGHGGRPVKRFLAAAGQAGELLKVRRVLGGVLQAIKPDLVWVNNEKSLAFVLGPLLKARMPVALYYRGWGTSDQIGPFFKYLLKRKTDGVIVHSTVIADRFISYRVPRRKVFATPNAVGLVAAEADLKKGEIGLPGMERNLKILLPAARPVRDKGLDIAVRALKRLREKGADAVLWITGTVPMGVESRYLEDVKSYLSRFGLEDDVHFIGWRDDLQAVIARADVVIVPSRTEGFPRVVVEAMLLGVPVCATPVGGVPEAVIDGQTGFLIDVGDYAKLAERIATLGSDAVLRTAMTGAARTLAHEMFSLEKQTAAVSEIFQSIVENRKKPHV